MASQAIQGLGFSVLVAEALVVAVSAPAWVPTAIVGGVAIGTILLFNSAQIEAKWGEITAVLAKSGKDSSKIKGKLGVTKLQVGMNTPDPEDPNEWEGNNTKKVYKKNRDWELEKDTAGHAGKKWKLTHRGERKASLSPEGKIISIP